MARMLIFDRALYSEGALIAAIWIMKKISSMVFFQ